MTTKKARDIKCWMRSEDGKDDYTMFVNEQPEGGFGWKFYDFEPSQNEIHKFKPIYISLTPREDDKRVEDLKRRLKAQVELTAEFDDHIGELQKTIDSQRAVIKTLKDALEMNISAVCYVKEENTSADKGDILQIIYNQSKKALEKLNSGGGEK